MYQDTGFGITSRQKAAMLVRMFDKETARVVIGNLSTDEKEKLVREIAIMPDYEQEELQFVMEEYIEHFQLRNIGSMTSGVEYVKDLFDDLNPKELEQMIGKVYYDVENPFDFLSKIKDLEPLLTLLDGEDPQTIAIVCSFMKPNQAADLLEKLPEEKMVKTVLAIAALDQIDSELLVKISSNLNKKLDGMAYGENNKTDGIKTVVGILNNVSRGTEKTVFERLDVIDVDLSNEIKENMFIFDDLVKLDALTLQKVLNEIQDVQLLAKAMKPAKEELKDVLFKAMSEGRREQVVEEIEGMGALRVADAEKAQQDIANVVKNLEKSGTIVIQRGEEDVIV